MPGGPYAARGPQLECSWPRTYLRVMVIAVSCEATIHHCARIVPRGTPADFVGNIKTINVEEMIQYPQVCALDDV